MRYAVALLTLALLACVPVLDPPSARADETRTNAAYDAAEGTKFRMKSLIGIGDIVIGDEFLTTSNGEQIPIRKITEGLYAFPKPPSKLTNGQDFCFSTPVTGFTWHRHLDGLWVMNVGDWREAPVVPSPDTWQAKGGCGLFTYEER